MSYPSKRAHRLLTERLELRCYEPRDAEELQAVSARNREHLIPFMPWALRDPETVDEKLELIRKWRGWFDTGRDFIYRVQRRGESEQIGGCGLHYRISGNGAEIGYWIDERETRQGYATELAAALTRFSLEVQEPSRVVIQAEVENELSLRIPERLGFQQDGVLRRSSERPEELNRDMVLYSLLPEELAASPAASAKYEAFDDLGRVIGAGE
ncbi:MAG: GNAT family N-acetyltransferase [Planctomycetes bacterium]|nr:GNAT family N-acetyltransferase [Planctomycetota bacterium]